MIKKIRIYFTTGCTFDLILPSEEAVKGIQEAFKKGKIIDINYKDKKVVVNFDKVVYLDLEYLNN